MEQMTLAFSVVILRLKIWFLVPPQRRGSCRNSYLG